jgi:hypothetical protein
VNLHTPQEPTLNIEVAKKRPRQEGPRVVSHPLGPLNRLRGAACTISYREIPYIHGRNIRTLSIRYNPLAPKAGALAPMGEKNQTPNITFASTCAETLRFGGAGVQHSVFWKV